VGFRDGMAIDKTSEHGRLTLESQRELRRLLFRHVDFAACKTVLDFGCGYATDLMVLARRYPQATLTTRVAIPVARAALAFRRGEWVRTLELLAPVEPYDSTPFTEFWPAFLRGQASLHLKQPEQAQMLSRYERDL